MHGQGTMATDSTHERSERSGVANHKRHAHLPVTVHIMVERESRVLLLRRSNTGYRDGWLSLPAGHLDGDEELCAAAARELWEETGLEVETRHLVPVQVMHRRDGRESVDFFVATSGLSSEPVNREPHKCSELIWCSLSDLPADVIPYIRRAVENHRARRAFDSYGW
jgi:8-oxo-dGTP diphosphatase